jgi:hypothetical protein
VAAHLEKCFPKECQALGEPVLREMIQGGIKQSQGYGITSERGVCKYIDIMVKLGSDFDHDPGLPWARAILTDSADDPSVKINRLYAAAIEKFER